MRLPRTRHRQALANAAPPHRVRFLGIAAFLLSLSPAAGIAQPPSSVAPIPDAATEIAMTLEDAIQRALEYNRSLLNRRLDREVDRFALDVAGDRFRPQLSLQPFVSRSRLDRRTGGGVRTTLRVPTGAEFALVWDEAVSREFEDTSAITLSLSQPLLRGALGGAETAPLRRAQMREQIQFLGLRWAVADLVVAVEGAYRGLIAASRQVEIGETALRRAQEELEATLALISAGRVARRESIRSEATIANRELSLARIRNRLEEANLRLADILELGRDARIRPLDTPSATPGQEASEPPLGAVLRRREDFLQAEIYIELARVDLSVASNTVLPDLRVGLDLSRDGFGRSDAVVRVDASIPLTDRVPRLDRLSARNEVRKAERDLAELRESIGIELRQAVNDVEVGLQLIELAGNARVLAEENLEIEREKFNYGLSSTFEVAASSDELVGAEQAEVDAILSLLDAQTRLERVSGLTLSRWGIRLEEVSE